MSAAQPTRTPCRQRGCEGLVGRRILLGSALPEVPGEKGNRDAVGRVVLGPDGADRVAVGAPTPNPLIRGTISPRRYIGTWRKKAAFSSGSETLMNMPAPSSNPATRVRRGMMLRYQ